MERSIETLWKEAFLKSDALVAPKLNNLYNQKSKHLVDRFKRMFRINLNAILFFAFFVLFASYFTGIFYMGIALFLMFISIVVINRRLCKGLYDLDNSVDSYQYLKSFDGWLKKQIDINTKMSRFTYPYVVLSLILGFWFVEVDGGIQGEVLLNSLISEFPGWYQIGGVPLVGIIGLIILLGLSAYVGGKLYGIEMNAIYGKVINKLDEIIADMEELRS